MNNPHRSRRLALQALCCVDAQGPSAWNTIEIFLRDSRESTLLIDDAIHRLRRAFDARPDSDAILTRHARRWELPRLALVDRNILRLAVQELVEGKTPYKVVISESLHLARAFSTSESPRFINGILDAVARECNGKGGPAEPVAAPEAIEEPASAPAAAPVEDSTDA